MEREKTWHKFWSSFGWPAYDERDVPDDARYPYLTYDFQSADLDTPVYPSITLWDRSTSWTSVTEKQDEIAARIKTKPCIKINGEGFLWIVAGTPFYQRGADDDDTVRRIDINVAALFLTAI